MPRSFLTCTLVAAWFLFDSAQGACAQAVFPTPEAGASALVDALACNDDAAMQRVLGRDFRRFLPAHDVNQDDVYRFLGAWSQGHEIVSESASEKKPAIAHIAVGTDGWTLPIPLVETQRGWRFDPIAGRDELLTRRIGRNERAAMRTSLAYLDAQRGYRALTHHYAQRLVSRPGQRDGLYWPAAAGETPSPLDPSRSRCNKATARLRADITAITTGFSQRKACTRMEAARTTNKTACSPTGARSLPGLSRMARRAS
jgi:hypothetical protein